MSPPRKACRTMVRNLRSGGLHYIFKIAVWPVFALYTSRARSAFESRRRPGHGAFRIRFMATRYSFRNSNCWSTVPVKVDNQSVCLVGGAPTTWLFDFHVFTTMS